MFHHQASHKSFNAFSSFWLPERERAPGSSRRQVLKWKSSFQAGSLPEWQMKESPDHLKQISIILSNYIWVHLLPYEVYLNTHFKSKKGLLSLFLFLLIYLRLKLISSTVFVYVSHTYTPKNPQLISLFGCISKVTYIINMSNILIIQIILLRRSVRSCPVKSHIVNHLEEANR